MAIIKELGLEVKVNIDGSSAAEYPDQEPDVDHGPTSQATKACHHYVESIDNAEFAIHAGLIPGSNTGRDWIGRSQDHRLHFSVALDGGHDVAAVCLSQHHNTVRLVGVHNRMDQTLRKFLFSPVTTVDDANKKRVASDMKVAQNLGLIRVSVRRATVNNKEFWNRPSRHDVKLGKHGISLAEKALKGRAVSHGAALSAPIKSTRCKPYNVEYADGDSPLAVFYFKYRSKEALQQQLIITRPRSLSMESDLENLSPDEIRRLARERLLQMKDGKKRAVSVKDEDDAKVIKSDRPFKHVRIEGGRKAIDLTEDD